MELVQVWIEVSEQTFVVSSAYHCILDIERIE